MHINLDGSAPLPRALPIGLKIAAFLASLALVFSGVLYATMAITAYIGGDLVGAVGKGVDQAAAHAATSADTAGATDELHAAAKSAGDFALRAKLIALAVGAVAAALFLAGELVRRRYTHRAVPIVIGLAAAGQAALTILFGPSILLALGLGACAFGAFVWTRVVRDAAVPLAA